MRDTRVGRFRSALLVSAAALALVVGAAPAALAAPSPATALPGFIISTPPTPGLAAIVNATTVKSKSVTAIVSFPAGLPVSNTTEIRLTSNSSLQLTQNYNPATGNRFVYNFPAGTGAARPESIFIGLTEHAAGGDLFWQYVTSATIDPRWDITFSPLTFNLLQDCDGFYGTYIPSSEPRIYWNDDRGLHSKELSMYGGETRTISEFGRSLSSVGVGNNIQIPAFQFFEEDPNLGFHSVIGYTNGPLLPLATDRTNAPVSYTLLDSHDGSCSGVLSYSVTSKLLTYPNL